MKIVVDSCCDLNQELKKIEEIKPVPLTINIEDKQFIDEDLDIHNLMAEMKKSSEVPKTACPSPSEYYDAFKESNEVYAVTLSSKLSGSYNSAMIAKEMHEEENENRFVHVFDSLSAASGETAIALKIIELKESGLKPLEIVKETEKYIKSLNTYFVLESLENMIKAGRMSRLKGSIASKLSINPIMRGNNGSIEHVQSVRGNKKTLERLVEIIGETGENFEEKILSITHCNALSKALKIKEGALKYKFKDIVIVEAKGISTIYANDGGIIIAY